MFQQLRASIPSGEARADAVTTQRADKVTNAAQGEGRGRVKHKQWAYNGKDRFSGENDHLGQLNILSNTAVLYDFS